MINITNLSYQYRSKEALFEDLDLRLDPGKIYGLLGLNGAGKSTLLYLLQGMLYPKSGHIDVLGHKPSHRTVDFLNDVYMIPERPHVPNMSIGRYISLYAPFYKAFDKDKFYDLLIQFGLYEKRHFKKLSMGEKKKVLIAFGLSTNARVLLMDEPTNGLDIPSKAQFRKLLSSIITDDKIIIISSHQIRDLHRLLDDIIVLDKGTIIFQENIAEIERVLTFQLTHDVPSPEQYLYYERVPGGYFTIQPYSKFEDSLEVDIEILFNALITYPDDIIHLFNLADNHANKLI